MMTYSEYLKDRMAAFTSTTRVSHSSIVGSPRSSSRASKSGMRAMTPRAASATARWSWSRVMGWLGSGPPFPFSFQASCLSRSFYLNDATLAAPLTNYLNSGDGQRSLKLQGRHYGKALLKLEPRNLLAVHTPRPDFLLEKFSEPEEG